MKIDKMINWQFQSHMNMDKDHALMETATYKGFPIRRETHTKYRNGKPVKSQVIYWTPSDKANYKTLEELLMAIDRMTEMKKKKECRNVAEVAEEAAKLKRDNPEWGYKQVIDEAKRILKYEEE